MNGLYYSILALCCGAWVGCYFPQQTPNVIANYDTQSLEKPDHTEKSQNFPSAELEISCVKPLKYSEPRIVSFAATSGEECEWQQGYNVAKGELGVDVASFRSQSAEIEVTKGHKICGLEISSRKKIGRFNDAIILTAQGRIIASYGIKDNATILADSVQGQRLEKFRLIGTKHAINTFCPQGIECNIPNPVRPRSIEVNVGPSYLKRLSELELRNHLKIELITTGNRNIVDCQHTGVELSLRYSYIDEDEQGSPVSH